MNDFIYTSSSILYNYTFSEFFGKLLHLFTFQSIFAFNQHVLFRGLLIKSKNVLEIEQMQKFTDKLTECLLRWRLDGLERVGLNVGQSSILLMSND